MRENSQKIFAMIAYHPRWWLVVVAFWGVFASTSYFWQYSRLQADAIEMATLRGRLVFSMVQITRAWNAEHGGLYAPITSASPENPYLIHPDKFATTRKGKPLTLINPAYMTRQINTLLSDKTDLKIHLTSLNPINPGNKPDAWESKALNSFEQGVKEQLIFQGEGETATFRYMAPLFVQQGCLQCHAKQGYKLGQVRGGLSVSQPQSYITGLINSQKNSILVIHLAIFFLLSVVSLISLWQNRKQIVNLEIARDERKKSADELVAKVDELERTRDYLVQSEKHASLGRMVAGFAHEINTPIGIALSAISHSEETIKELNALLLQEEVKEEDIVSHLDTLGQADKLALSNLRRAADLVRSFKRTSIDQSSDQARKFEMRELIDDLLATLHSQFKRTQIQINVDCEKNIMMFGIPGLLEQLLTNLLLNSLQHAFDEGLRAGTINIEVKYVSGARIAIHYADDGVGMSAEILSKIFEPFFTTARGKGGSGLGMYVCYDIVSHQLGGSISVNSVVNEGSRFDIDFPSEQNK